MLPNLVIQGMKSLCKIGIDVDTYPHVFKKTLHGIINLIDLIMETCERLLLCVSVVVSIYNVRESA